MDLLPGNNFASNSAPNSPNVSLAYCWLSIKTSTASLEAFREFLGAVTKPGSISLTEKVLFWYSLNTMRSDCLHWGGQPDKYQCKNDCAFSIDCICRFFQSFKNTSSIHKTHCGSGMFTHKWTLLKCKYLVFSVLLMLMSYCYYNIYGVLILIYLISLYVTKCWS